MGVLLSAQIAVWSVRKTGPHIALALDSPRHDRTLRADSGIS